VVGHADLVAGDRVGDRDRHRGRRAAPQTVEVGAHGRLQRGVLGAGQHLHVGDRRAGRGLPGEAGVGAADVGQQAGGVGRGLGHGVGSGKGAGIMPEL
jgi:hypothetical protein